MKRKTIVQTHIVATVLAAIIISTFFSFSLLAELNGEANFIKKVKEWILYSLPAMILVMAILNITGNKLAGNLQNSILLAKRKRMKFIFLNGIGLLSLAFFLYNRSHHQAIDSIFLAAQIAEFLLGFTNLVLIGMNARSGFQLSGRSRIVQ